MKNKVSNLVKETRVMNSKSYNELTPVMKEAVKEVIKIIENEQKDIIKSFEGAVEKVVASRNIKQEDLYSYFEKEVNEQLGIK
jgi:TRAP-type C4-dicarboxylate transport system substrate-binding protein